MDMGKQDLEGSDPIAPASEVARLRLDIVEYERLLQTGLGLKTQKMFEHLLARMKAELAAGEAEETASQALLAEASGPR